MRRTSLIQIHTENSQESEIDLFSRLEVNFLQKYFKCLLTDNFSDFLINVYEEYFYKKLNHKQSKFISNSLFEVKNDFMIEDFVQKIQNYFKEKSQSVSSNQFSTAIKFLHSSRLELPNLIKNKQLVYIDVRIKLQVAKIQEIPQNIQQLFEKYVLGDNQSRSNDKKFQKMLSNYNKQFFNVFIVYYGVIHFNFKLKKSYSIQTMKIAGRNIKVRIFVFYISKIALFQTFKSTNKINIEGINDLVISFYEIKREKQKLNKSKKKEIKINPQQNRNENLMKIVALTTGLGVVVAAGFLFVKNYFF